MAVQGPPAACTAWRCEEATTAVQIAKSSACLLHAMGACVEWPQSKHSRVIKQAGMPSLKPVPAVRQSRQPHLVILLLHSRIFNCQSLAGTAQEGHARK